MREQDTAKGGKRHVRLSPQVEGKREGLESPAGGKSAHVHDYPEMVSDRPEATEFLQALRPRDVAHYRAQLLRWWSTPGKWQREFAMQGRLKLPGWTSQRFSDEADQSRWWMAETFKRAELYWVSPEMTDVLVALAPTIPDCTPQPPCDDAFVVFAKSVPGTDAQDGATIYTSGLLWGTVTLFQTGLCIATETYAWRDLVHHYHGLSEEHQEHFRQIYPNRLMPTGGSEWPMGVLASDFTKLPIEEEVARASILEDRRLLATFWALCSQKIVVERRERAPRPLQRQAQREGFRLPDIRVICLREQEVRGPSETGRDVEWSHRWLVGPHWRNQWYPSRGEHAPKLIHSYVKGPPDKPLKVRETVKALVR